MPILTNFPYDPLLDLAPWVGQRQATYRFDLSNGVSGEDKGEIYPIRGGARLAHDTTRIIKRQLSLSLGARDTAYINPLQDRVMVTMVFPNGQEYPLGRYLFTDQSRQLFTSGELSNVVLSDEMYLVDQVITEGFTGVTSDAGNPIPVQPGHLVIGAGVTAIITNLLRSLPVEITIEPSPFSSTQGWGIGARRGSIVESLAIVGDFFSPWFGNDGRMHFIRAFNPALKIPDFDWDRGNSVMRSSILSTSNILNAPNRFVVISNSPSDPDVPTFGVANVPVNAPHSFENRGFVIAEVQDLQAVTATQCVAIAENLAQRQLIYETTTVTTAPDPRHDSYNVIYWQGELWLELSWSMTLTEGAPMQHTLRRAYR